MVNLEYQCRVLIAKDQAVSSTFNFNFTHGWLWQRNLENLVQWKLVFHPKLGRNWESPKCLSPRYHLPASCSGVSSARSLKWSTRAHYAHGRDSVSGRRFDITSWFSDSEASLLSPAFCLNSQKRKGRPFRKLESFGHFLHAICGISHSPACWD